MLGDGGLFFLFEIGLFDMAPDGLFDGRLRPTILRRARSTLESAIDIHDAFINADDAAAGIPLAAGDAGVGRYRAVHAYATSQIIAAAAMAFGIWSRSHGKGSVRLIWDPY